MKNKPLLIVIFLVVAIFIFVFLQSSGFLRLFSQNIDSPFNQQPDENTDPSESENNSDEVNMVLSKVASIAANITEINSEGELRLLDIEKVDWPNACLGAEQPEELCAQVITPGYRVVLVSGETEIIYHTNLTGESIRLKEIVSLSN